MNILFIHQGFPGQYKNIVNALGESSGVQLVSLGIEELPGTLPSNLSPYRYGIPKGNTPNIHPWVLETESKIIRGEACARAAHELKSKGFRPDLICAHPGWGESLFLRQVWPNVPILHYQEFYYRDSGFDSNFDSEIQGIGKEWHEKAKPKVKNASLLLSLEDSNWNVCPTKFQRSSFPDHWQQSISVIHDGIDTKTIKPNHSVTTDTLRWHDHLTKGQDHYICKSDLRALPRLPYVYPGYPGNPTQMPRCPYRRGWTNKRRKLWSSLPRRRMV